MSFSAIRTSIPARAGLSLLALALTAVALEAAPYGRGDTVTITGVVTDGQGTPLPNLQVVLVAARSAFDFRTLSKERRHGTRLAATTDADGEFQIDWPWEEFYNRFDLQVGVLVRDTEGEKLRELQRVDLTRRIRQGSPVVTTLTVEDTRFLREFRDFMARLESEDQRSTYQRVGYPGRVDRFSHGGHEEVTWWYFRIGRAYRFRDGRLDKVIEFEPVRSF